MSAGSHYRSYRKAIRVTLVVALITGVLNVYALSVANWTLRHNTFDVDAVVDVRNEFVQDVARVRSAVSFVEEIEVRLNASRALTGERVFILDISTNAYQGTGQRYSNEMSCVDVGGETYPVSPPGASRLSIGQIVKLKTSRVWGVSDASMYELEDLIEGAFAYDNYRTVLVHHWVDCERRVFYVDICLVSRSDEWRIVNPPKGQHGFCPRHAATIAREVDLVPRYPPRSTWKAEDRVMGHPLFEKLENRTPRAAERYLVGYMADMFEKEQRNVRALGVPVPSVTLTVVLLLGLLVYVGAHAVLVLRKADDALPDGVDGWLPMSPVRMFRVCSCVLIFVVPTVSSVISFVSMFCGEMVSWSYLNGEALRGVDSLLDLVWSRAFYGVADDTVFSASMVGFVAIVSGCVTALMGRIQSRVYGGGSDGGREECVVVRFEAVSLGVLEILSQQNLDGDASEQIQCSLELLLSKRPVAVYVPSDVEDAVEDMLDSSWVEVRACSVVVDKQIELRMGVDTCHD